MEQPQILLVATERQEDWVTISGQRFFRTGDIGQLNKDGSLSIIDRKKDRAVQTWQAASSQLM